MKMINSNKGIPSCLRMIVWAFCLVATTTSAQESTAESDVLAAALAAAVQNLPVLGDPDGMLPEGDGRDVTIQTCTKCHLPERVISKNMDASEWQTVMQNMVTRGASMTDDQFSTILSYLSTSFPLKLNLNTATMEEIASGLGLKVKDAKAIVAAREKNGAFTSIDDLRKIQGIEFRRIRAKEDSISF